jgi:hypothetical protein
MAMINFVKILSVQSKSSPKRVVTNDPRWEDVEAAISGLDTGSNRFFELSESAVGTSVMTVYGNAGAYHISIIENETEQSWLVFGPQNENRVEIGGSQFPMHQVCEDGALARTLIRSFFESGVKSPDAEWFTLELEE